jgi:ABC-type protease/lipase transport system fused ATPase/permease subunit
MVNTVAAFTSSAFALATPLISMVVYDRIIPHSSMHSMTAVVVAALVFVALDLSVRLARRAFMSARSKVLADQLAVAAFKGLMSEQRWTLGGGSEAVDRQIGTNLLKDADAVRNGLATAGATVFGEGPWLILFILVLVLLAPPVVAIVTAIAVMGHVRQRGVILWTA